MTAMVHTSLAAVPTQPVPVERSVRREHPHRPVPPVHVGWLQRYVRVVLLLDAVLLLAAGAVVAARSGAALGSLAVVVLWWGALGLTRCHEPRFLGSGTEEFRRVADASVRLTAVVAVVGYATPYGLPPNSAGLLLPLGAVLLVTGRFSVRLVVQARRRQGRCSRRVLVVGDADGVLSLGQQLRQEPLAGLQVVGTCVTGSRAGRADLSCAATVRRILVAMEAHGADAVAVASGPGTTPELLRTLSYDLEGSGIDMLVAPALTNVTGTRVSFRPQGGLPLLHVDEPELTGVRHLLKAGLDRSGALLLLLVLAPVLLVCALLVRATSAGPAFYRQERVGRSGRVFTLWKLRTMQEGSDRLVDALESEGDSVLFKLKQDPRVTPVGRVLRRYSLDELPQLLNVLAGQMSLVGPRPPLPREVEQYEAHVHRRLLVKPGLTGLWQISGRSDLSWEESVRLDLQYVESWSLGLDLTVLAKTGLAVLRGRGAY